MTQMLSANSSDKEGAGGSQGRPQLARQQAEQPASACNTAGAGDAGNHGLHEVQQQGQAAVATASAEQHSNTAEPGGWPNERSTAEVAAALEHSVSQLHQVQQLAAALQASRPAASWLAAGRQPGARQRSAASALQMQVQRAAVAAAEASCAAADAKAQKAAADAASAVQQLQRVQQL
jgi:hypothetical protein